MAKNKKEIKIYNPEFEKFKKEYARSQKNPKYTMPKATKKKILALVAAGWLTFTGLHTTAMAMSDHPSPQPKDTYTIGISKDDATINVGGKDYKIDDNSFVITSNSTTIAYDETGTLHRGYVNEEDFEKVLELTKEEMSRYIICQVNSENGVNVRATGNIEDGNIISTVSYNDYVLASPSKTPEKGDEWLSTLSIEGDTIHKGYIREDLLNQVNIVDNRYYVSQDNFENLMYVNASHIGSDGLNLRTHPNESDKRTIMTRIPNDSIVNIVGDTIFSDGREWCQIEYQTDDGEHFNGWVAKEYLTPYITLDKTISTKPESQISQSVEENTINQVATNANGNVTGIDVSTISPDKLRELLQNGIPNEVSTIHGDVNTSQFASDINFVYIKLGASNYGKSYFSPTDYNNYEEQVKICEELGVPYGFYYYSTAVTEEEAKIELEHIKQKIENLRQKYNLEHNQLEIVVDVELAGTNDRQYKGNIQEQTKAKATLINGIQEEGLSDNVLLYGPMRVMRPDADQIISLSDLHSMLSNPEDVSLWLCAPTSKSGNLPSNVEDYKQYIEEQGFSVAMLQVVLDGNVIGRIDINNMDLDHYQKLLNYDKSIHQEESVTMVTSQDDGR